MTQRIASLWRNADDSMRARIFTRASIGATNAGASNEFDVDIYMASNITTASGEIGDVFYSRAEALEYIKLHLGPTARAMRLPKGADRWNDGMLLTVIENA